MSIVRTVRRLGWAGFVFFALKGVGWLILAAAGVHELRGW